MKRIEPCVEVLVVSKTICIALHLLLELGKGIRTFILVYIQHPAAVQIHYDGLVHMPFLDRKLVNAYLFHAFQRRWSAVGQAAAHHGVDSVPRAVHTLGSLHVCHDEAPGESVLIMLNA